MKSMVPKIRFKSFIDEWDEDEMGNVVDINPKCNIPDIFKYVDLESVKETKIVSFSNEIKKFAPSRAQRLAKYGDIFFQTVRPYQKNNCIFAINDNNYVFSSGYAQIRSHINNYFLFNYLFNDSFLTDVMNLCTGTSFPAISSKDFVKIKIKFPKFVEEQKAIGQYFNNLDEIISDSECKLSKLKEIKKTMLYKMFPQNSKKVPEIRLKGFEGEWDNLQLKHIGDPYTSLSGKSKDDFGHGKAKYVTYMNVLLNPIADIKRTEKIEIDNTQNFVKKGDVFFTVSSETPEEVGMSSVWMADDENVYLNSFCFGFRPKINIDYYFLAYAFRNEYFRKQMRFLAQGISRYNISKNKVIDLNIYIPKDMKEQKAIGKYFYKFDNMIDEYTQKITKLKELKKTLLNKMFA